MLCAVSCYKMGVNNGSKSAVVLQALWITKDSALSSMLELPCNSSSIKFMALLVASNIICRHFGVR